MCLYWQIWKLKRPQQHMALVAASNSLILVRIVVNLESWDILTLSVVALYRARVRLSPPPHSPTGLRSHC